MSKSNTFVVYKLTFPNQKVYIGISSEIAARIRAHKHKEKLSKIHPLVNAIKKYKWKNVVVDYLFKDLQETDACEKEQELIKYYSSNNIDFGYNLDIGGKTRLGSKNKIPSPNKGKALTKEHVNNLIKAKQGKDYSHISSTNATKYSLEARNIITNTIEVYKNVTEFCNKYGYKLQTVYNHIYRNSQKLDKKWKLIYINKINYEQGEYI